VTALKLITILVPVCTVTQNKFFGVIQCEKRRLAMSGAKITEFLDLPAISLVMNGNI